MLLYHGSQNMIESPVFGYGNAKNDYGIGFYCTENVELAMEWACTGATNGWANQYELELDGLDVLHLNDKSFHILNWLAILLQNRTFVVNTGLPSEAKSYLLEQFLPEYASKDVIIGYRADDSYFSFAQAFLNNTISLEQLRRAMYLGNLGEQVVLKSSKAFKTLTFVKAIEVDAAVYYAKRMSRDDEAREAFRKEKTAMPVEKAVYMVDILRQKWNNDDPRLF